MGWLSGIASAVWSGVKWVGSVAWGVGEELVRAGWRVVVRPVVETVSDFLGVGPEIRSACDEFEQAACIFAEELRGVAREKVREAEEEFGPAVLAWLDGFEARLRCMIVESLGARAARWLHSIDELLGRLAPEPPLTSKTALRDDWEA